MNKEERVALIEDNMRLVKSIASEYSSRTTVEFDDLCQEGAIGLMRAAEKFDPEMGNQFSTYATYWIKQKIHRAIENAMPTTKKLAKSRSKIYSTRTKLEKAGIDVTYQMIADELSLTAEEVASVLNMEQISLDAPISTSDSISMGDVLADEGKSVEDSLMQKETAKMLREVVEQLSSVERDVIYERYFANEAKISTYAEVSERLNISRQRLQQIERKALQKMKRTKELWRHVNVDHLF